MHQGISSFAAFIIIIIIIIIKHTPVKEQRWVYMYIHTQINIQTEYQLTRARHSRVLAIHSEFHSSVKGSKQHHEEN